MPPGSPPDSTTLLQPSKPFSLSLGTKSKATVASLVKGKKRPHSTLAEDSGSDNETQKNAHQLVSTFDKSVGGAIGPSALQTAKAPLVIASQKNRDWRVEAGRKRGRNLIPAEEQARRDGRTNGAGAEEGGKEENQPVYGLIITDQGGKDGDEHVSLNENGSRGDPVEPEVAGITDQPKTEDEEAMEALLNDGKKRPNLVIPGSGTLQDRLTPRISEEHAFRSDIASRPESASLADYSEVPIEEFGAAMLRGMGWKEGDAVGRNKRSAAKPRLVEQRPALLGIGASKVPEGLEELGAWGKGAKKITRIDRSYAPVVLKNAKTGEILTEQELNARKEREKLVEDDWREKKRKELTNNDEGKSNGQNHRKRDRDEAYHKNSRHSSSHRDRSRSRERQRKREKDRERHRHHDRRREHDYDHGRRSDEDRSGNNRQSNGVREDRPRQRREDHGYDKSDTRGQRARSRERNGDRYGDRERHRRKD